MLFAALVCALAVCWLGTAARANEDTFVASSGSLETRYSQKNDLAAVLKREAWAREERARRCGATLPWKVFAAAPNGRYDGCVVELRQDDFARGTVRLRRPGVYRLVEDIHFNPNPDTDWLPFCDDPRDPRFQPEYCSPRGGPSKPYRLGFFAAVTIEGDDITLDLNGKTLAQTEEHALQQRFFALVELASQPFIVPKNDKPQGPAPDGFGDNRRSARHAAVINGVLGLSAHHGIHGNTVEDVLISSLKIRDYEVASVHVNGAKRLAIVDVHAEGHREDIPVRATYSGGRFLLQALAPHLARGNLLPEAKEDIENRVRILKDAMNEAKDEILRDGKISDPELDRQFGLEPTSDGRRVVDGNTYGMALSSSGVVTHEFKPDLRNGSKFGELKNVLVRNVHIHKTAANIQETPTVSLFNKTTGKAEKEQVDSAGSVVRMSEILNDDKETYKADYLHDLRFAVAWWASEEHGNDPYLVKARKGNKLGTFSITGYMAEWAREGLKISDVMRKNRYEWVCNIDSMAHRQKGIVGLLIQNGHGIRVERVDIKDTKNYAVPGSDMCGRYLFARGTKKARMVGYTGMFSRGLFVVASHKVRIRRTHVTDTTSVYGHARGVETRYDTRDVSLKHLTVCNTTAEHKDEDSLPSKPGRGDGLVVGENTRGLSMYDVKVVGEIP